MPVVLDNCEHQLDAATDLAQLLLSAAAGTRVLATSRAALGLSGKTVIPVRQLGLPAPGAGLAVTAAAESVRLFIDRAGEAWPGVCLASNWLVTAAEICRRMDCIPLAIERAAAQLHMLSLAQILALLEQRCRLLDRGRRALPRQQTLLAVVQWSWDRLTADEQHLLAALAVCSERCDLAADHALHLALDGQAVRARSAAGQRRRCGDDRRLGKALTGLGAAAAQGGQHDEAARRDQELLALRRKQPHRFGLGAALLNCAGTAISLKRTEAGRACLHGHWALAAQCPSTRVGVDAAHHCLQSGVVHQRAQLGAGSGGSAGGSLSLPPLGR